MCTFRQNEPNTPQAKIVTQVCGKADENEGRIHLDRAAGQKATGLLKNGPSLKEFLNREDVRQVNIKNEKHYIPQTEYNGENRKGRNTDTVNIFG